MTTRLARKLVTLPPETLAAVEKFRNSDAMKTHRCPTCSQPIDRPRTKPPTESETLRLLIEAGLDAYEGKS